MSIRLRLALWYSTILALILVILGVAVYVVMAQHMDDVLRERVTARWDHLAAFVAAPDVPAHEPHLLPLPPQDLLEGPDMYAEVMDGTGDVLLISRSLDGAPVAVPADALQRARAGKSVFFPVAIDGSRYLARIAPVTSSEGSPAGFILVAVGSREGTKTLTTLWKVLLVGGGLGILAAAIVGWSVAARALRPVAHMIDTARAITLSRGLSRRLPVARQQDELAQLARAFNEMLASLETASATEQRFIADASHELRAPLTTIRANLDLLYRADALPPAERQATLDTARKEAERMSRLVADLLSLARADAGQSVQRNRTQLDSILLEVYDQAAGAGRRLRVTLGALEPLTVLGDSDRLRQLLLILVDNALRYTPQGGSVSLSLRREGPWATVSVVDTGPGIHPDDLPHIFERFYRSEAARKTDPSGTGLGLSIARWIADQHGGHIDVESSPGKGSTFTVRLPALG